jgi:hypothetical protein
MPLHRLRNLKKRIKTRKKNLSKRSSLGWFSAGNPVVSQCYAAGCSSQADVHARFFANYPSIPCFSDDISVCPTESVFRPLSYPSIRTICIIDLGWARVYFPVTVFASIEYCPLPAVSVVPVVYLFSVSLLTPLAFKIPVLPWVSSPITSFGLSTPCLRSSSCHVLSRPSYLHISYTL